MFQLEKYGTNRGREAIAGLTTFFAMAYILIVVPNLMSATGMPWGAVFIASVLASAIGSLVMALYANSPFVLAPGLGMVAFFTVTAFGALGFTWQQALSVVFICGVVNLVVSVTSLRKRIIAAVPRSLQIAISCGIGIFVAYLGMIQAGLVDLSSGTPILQAGLTPSLFVFFVGLASLIILKLRHVRAAVIISITLASVAAFAVGITDFSQSIPFTEAVSQLPETFGVVFTSEGLPSLFSDSKTLLGAIVLIMMFCFVDMFDSIGTFLGVGRQSGVFTEEEMECIGDHSKKTRLDRALVADCTGTLAGSVLGTSNTTTVIESVTGISAGGRTGLTSVVTVVFILLSMLFVPVLSLVPIEATAGVLVIVGITMMEPIRQIRWDDLSEAIPAFFASVFMALCFNISYGIAAGFIAYCLVKIIKGEYRQIHPMLIGVSVFFLVAMALMSTL